MQYSITNDIPMGTLGAYLAKMLGAQQQKALK